MKLKSFYIYLVAFIMILLSPFVCCESQVLRTHQNVDIQDGSMFTRYTYWHGNIDDVYVISRGVPKDYFIVEDNSVPIPCDLKNGDELYDYEGNYFGYIKVLRDGNIELRNCSKSAMNGVYRAVSKPARTK